MAQHAEQTITHGALRFIAPHPVLAELAVDLARGLSAPELCAQPLDILVGVHRLAPRRPAPGRRLLGLQTEQIRDAKGQPMWKKVKPSRLRKHLLLCHHMLDFSASNTPAYGWLGQLLRHRLSFGPHIFPERPVPYAPGHGAVFFGAMNPRRSALVETYGLRALPCGTFGAALAAEIAKAAAVVNLHYAEGLYTEAPRILAAYLAGKPVVSEPLAPPFVAGRHYLPLGQSPVPGACAEVHARLSDEIGRSHQFAGIVAKAAGLNPP